MPQASALRVLGIDPGLTRCGVGVVDVGSTRRAVLIDVQVLRTPADMPLEQRILSISTGLAALLDEHRPQAVALERVFAQANLNTVMGVAQISGVAIYLAAQRGLRVGLHTPTEVKAAITGYGAADKKQVGTMVARVLGLAEAPRPADASDALALAICLAWKSGGAMGGPVTSSGPVGDGTPAQRAWLAAERAASSVRDRRLGT